MFNWSKKHTKDGLEVPDPTPIEINIKRPLTLQEQIIRFTQSEFNKQQLQKAGIDTFDEADDFDTGDLEDDDFKSPYEKEFDGINPQTRLDEIRGSMVEEMPIDRQDRAQERLKAIRKGPIKQEKTADVKQDTSNT